MYRKADRMDCSVQKRRGNRRDKLFRCVMMRLLEGPIAGQGFAVSWSLNLFKHMCCSDYDQPLMFWIVLSSVMILEHLMSCCGILGTSYKSC